jgi:Uma2 family endonuclease
MSTIVKPTVVRERPDEATYRYGWRDILHKCPDGSIVVDRIPLTEEDVLHPQEGDKIMHTDVHDVDCHYLVGVSRARIANDPKAVAFHDVCIDWDDPALRHHSPDVSVIFGLRERRSYYGRFHVAREGVRPRVLIEVVSPDSRDLDLVKKFKAYHEAQVPYYVIVDRERPEGPPRILAYVRTPREYVPLPPDKDGRVWLEPLGIWLGTRDNRVVCYDGATGEELGDYAAVTQALATAKARIAAETARAEAERVKAEAERVRAEAERVRAEAAEARIAEEVQARSSLEARLRELEGRLHPPGEPPTPGERPS